MSRYVAAGLCFLLAVLRFEPMFDVQTRGHDGEILPSEVREPIIGDYRRATTGAYPMIRQRALARSIYDDHGQAFARTAFLIMFQLGAESRFLARPIEDRGRMAPGIDDVTGATPQDGEPQ